MSTIYDLRLKMIEFVRAGLIERDEYDSLFEVLCEARNLLPQHAADVDKAVQLLHKLLPAAQPAQGQRVYVVGSRSGLGEMMALHLAMRQRELRDYPPLDFVGLAIEPRTMAEEKELLRKRDLVPLGILTNHHGSPHAQQPYADVLANRFMSPEWDEPLVFKDKVQITLGVEKLPELPVKLPYEPKKQTYQGYHGARHRRGKKY